MLVQHNCISEKIRKMMVEVKELKEMQKSGYTHIRVSKINAGIIDDIWETLEIDCRQELDELNIKNLTRDDAITALLLAGMSQFGITLERLDQESNYLKILGLLEHNNIMTGE